MKKSFIIIFLMAIGLIVLASYLGGSVYLFLNLPSIILSVFLAFLLCLCTFNPSEIKEYFSIALRNDTSDIKKIKDGIHFFSLYQSNLITSGVMGFFLGVILLLANLSDPEALGPGGAVALLVVFYSLVFILIITTPFKSGLKRMLEEVE